MKEEEDDNVKLAYLTGEAKLSAVEARLIAFWALASLARAV